MGPLLERYDAFLFDLDGVLYRGDRTIDGAVEAVSALRAAGRGIAFMTNNSARTPEEVAARLTELGIAASPGEVATSAGPTARMLADRGVRSAFVIGETGIRSALSAAGIEVLSGNVARADAVVIGWDRTADFAALRTASVLVDGGAAFVGTNADASFPAPDGARWPGAGALLAAVRTTTGADPEVVGKPNAPLFLEALDLAGGGFPLVIGDRLDTDIAGAAALGWDSLLVLSGIAGRADLDAAPVRPTYVADDLSILGREPSAAENLARSGPAGRSAPGGILGALPSLERIRTMNADDVRKMLDSVFDKLSPAKAQELAKGLVGDDRREHAQKLAADLMDSAQRNRDKVKDLISREVAAQVKNMGVASQKDLDALRKRVRDLERAAGVTPKRATKSTAKTTSRAKRPAAQKSTTKSTSTSSRSSTA